MFVVKAVSLLGVYQLRPAFFQDAVLQVEKFEEFCVDVGFLAAFPAGTLLDVDLFLAFLSVFFFFGEDDYCGIGGIGGNVLGMEGVHCFHLPPVFAACFVVSVQPFVAVIDIYETGGGIEQ